MAALPYRRPLPLLHQAKTAQPILANSSGRLKKTANCFTSIKPNSVASMEHEHVHVGLELLRNQQSNEGFALRLQAICSRVLRRE